MTSSCRLFVERLQALDNVEDDDDLPVTLAELCATIKDDPEASSVIPHIFSFMEAHPEADLGAPGPLVHFLERRPDYAHHLIDSVVRKPTVPTVIMVNRVLNSHISPKMRVELMALLQSASSNANADEVAREQAEHFLEFQEERERRS